MGSRQVAVVRGFLNSLYSQTARWGVGHLVLQAPLTQEVIFTAAWAAGLQSLSPGQGHTYAMSSKLPLSFWAPEGYRWPVAPVLENSEWQEGEQRQGEERSDKSRNPGRRAPSYLQEVTVPTRALQKKGLGRTC